MQINLDLLKAADVHLLLCQFVLVVTVYVVSFFLGRKVFVI